MSARHAVLIRVMVRAKALRAVAAARAIKFAVRASTNLSRVVLFGLLAMIVVHTDIVERTQEHDAPPANVEIVQAHPVPTLGSPENNAAPPSTADGTSSAGSPPADGKPAAPVPPALQKAPEWTEIEIAEAKAECDRLLDKVEVASEPLPPERQGACGAPAPRELISLDGGKIKFQPRATLRCPMIAALNSWVSDKLQPAAKKTFGSPIARILAGSYSCRNRYGLARAPLSEHALMNAIDIAGFVLENGKVIRISSSWGEHKGEASEDPPKSSVRNKGAKTVTVVAVRVGTPGALAQPADGKAKKQHDVKESEKEPEKDLASEFLHLAHSDACKIFGTVLGPNANEAHRDHFHLDMKARKYRSICQ